MKGVIIATSTIADGPMKFEWGSVDQVSANSQAFLTQSGIMLEQTVNLFISGDTSWDIIRTVSRADGGEGMTRPDNRVAADALMTNHPGVALFLPTADCYPTVFYDTANQALCLAHLGWQSTAVDLARKVVTAMQQTYGTRAADLNVYFGPGIKPSSYVFTHPSQLTDPDWRAFLQPRSDGQWGVDLLGYNRHQLVRAGVPESAIAASPVDTASDSHYYSHYGSNRLNKAGPAGRFATVCMLPE